MNDFVHKPWTFDIKTCCYNWIVLQKSLSMSEKKYVPTCPWECRLCKVLANILVGVVNSEISQKDIAEDSNCNFPWGASAFDASEN